MQKDQLADLTIKYTVRKLKMMAKECDLNKGVIRVETAKYGLGRTLKLKPSTLDILKNYLAINNFKLDDNVFPKTKSMRRNIVKIRKRTAEKLKKIPQIMKEIVNRVNLAEFDRAHLSEFGDFTLNFEVVYYIKTPNYGKYMDVKQAINFGILEAFEKEKIVMPYPTQRILFEKD